MIKDTLKPPFFRTLTESCWNQFLLEYESYRAQCGSREIKVLISSTVRDVLAELDIDFGKDAEEEDIINQISDLFAPLSVVEMYERFASVRMSAEQFSVEAVLEYNLAYTSLCRLCRGTVCLSEERLVSLYLRGLRPLKLAQCVQLLELNSLVDVKRAAVKEAMRLRGMQQTLSAAVDCEFDSTLCDFERNANEEGASQLMPLGFTSCEEDIDTCSVSSLKDGGDKYDVDSCELSQQNVVEVVSSCKCVTGDSPVHTALKCLQVQVNRMKVFVSGYTAEKRTRRGFPD